MRTYDLTEEQLLIRETVRRISEEHFKPHAARVDRESRPPVEHIKIMADNGFCGLMIPEEFGGGGMSVFELVLVMEQVARCCANTAMLLGGSDGLTPRVIAAAGTEAQQKKYLPKMARGELFAAWSMSEANAGSDVGNVHTRAVRDGNEYVINGSKMWCSSAQLADVFVLIARLDDAPGMKGVGALLVERDAPGLTVGKHLDLIGLRSTGMAPLYFDECRVPADSLLVPAGGMRKMFEVLASDRVGGNPAICLGIASAALEGAVAYLRERKQFGRTLGEFQGLQWKLADMAVDVEAARSLLYGAARRAARGESSTGEASIVKIFVNEMAVRVTNSAIQLAGAYGLSTEFPFERYFRDVRGFSMGYGTPEVMRNMLASEILTGRYVL